jgi:peptidoglycan LD-endopeptidase LytH
MNLSVLMRNGTLAAGLLLAGMSAALCQSANPAPIPPTLYDYCQRFQGLYTGIREQKLTPDSARRSFRQIMLGLRTRFYGPAAPDTLYLLTYRRANLPPADSLTAVPLTGSHPTGGQPAALAGLGRFVFPLRGYGPAAIGGTHGEGYVGKGFDLFDYKVRGSHPAQDIFINDRDQDHLDDRTNRPVDVLAMRTGLVLAVETDWQPGSAYRGGNWIWVYDPVLHGLWYYAHNHRVLVTPGQWVEGGQKISEMGRTGFNAYLPRSPTHLHLMYLQIQPDGMPLPGNTYAWLVRAATNY